MMKNLHLLLWASLLLAGVACSSTPAGEAARPVAVVPSEGAVASFDAASLTEVAFEGDSAPRLVLKTTENPVYTSYSPQPDVFVVDLPRTSRDRSLTLPTAYPAGISSVAADEATELGVPLTRVTIRFDHPVTAAATATGESVHVTFDESIRTAEAPEAAPVLEPPAAVVAETIDEPAAPVVAPAFTSGPATALAAIRTSGSGASLQVKLEMDGAAEYTSFQLPEPLRVVIDLPGVANRMAEKSLELGDPYVKRIRISQFKPDVTRVVLDLDEMAEYQLVKQNDGMVFTFGTAPVYQPEATSVKATKVAEVTTPAEEPARKVEMVSQVVTEDVFAAISPVPPAKNKPAANVVISSPSPQTPPETTTSTESPTENALAAQEAAAIMSASRTLSPEERVYSGEPIDLTLKDADIRDVLRTFAQLTGLNIAIDPQVKGTVTVEFQDVPWDQALELILKQNGLAFDLDGNVMRIGTVERLSQEQEQTRKREEARRLNVATQTVIRDLSYAKATDVATLLAAMASPRGKIIVDSRTNQLIITEVPEYLQTMLNLIQEVDIATPQVVIEARIVETTKNFSRRLGVEWGFNADLDPALGTGTGLQFPNRVNIDGGPIGLGAGNAVLGLTLGNVLGTFDLDITLTAAESEGLAKIVSAPRVQTQDNTPAEIQSGVQIPIQTRVNFTTTVQYIDATLRLVVTPQITAEGTVIMEIELAKVEPALGLQVAGGQNSPLLTRRAKTRLMVRDGGTAVIGGIYQATDNDASSRIPFLHKIPVLGLLFKNQTIDKRHDELLIFITPRIVRG
ncbi:MAG: type IV pilus secretin PilQ [Thermoanaerobaculia bacterium]